MTKKTTFSQYKFIRKLSFNDFDRWIRAFYKNAYGAGYDDGMEDVKKDTEQSYMENIYTAVIEYDDLLDLILSVKGVGKRRALEIMQKLEDFGIDNRWCK